MENFNIKEMYEACFKTTKTMRVGDRVFDAGEPFLYFENLKIESVIDSQKKPIILKGGKYNAPLVMWQEQSNPITIDIVEGTLNKVNFNLLASSKLIEYNNDFLVFKNETVLTNSAGLAILSKVPYLQGKIFVYVVEDGSLRKITSLTITDNNLQTSENNKEIFISYYYIEDTQQISCVLGYKNLNNAFFDFEGKIYYQEESQGENKTCLIKAPKIQILSSLYMKVGAKVNPMVANFKAVAFPGDGSNGYALALRYLNKDIDGDL